MHADRRTEVISNITDALRTRTTSLCRASGWSGSIPKLPKRFPLRSGTTTCSSRGQAQFPAGTKVFRNTRNSGRSSCTTTRRTRAFHVYDHPIVRIFKRCQRQYLGRRGWSSSCRPANSAAQHGVDPARELPQHRHPADADREAVEGRSAGADLLTRCSRPPALPCSTRFWSGCFCWRCLGPWPFPWSSLYSHGCTIVVSCSAKTIGLLVLGCWRGSPSAWGLPRYDAG